MTTGKAIALTRWTFAGKAMPLLFNTLSGFVMAYLPRRKRLLISWLQSPSAVILEPKKRRSVTASTFSPPICQEVMGLDAMILVFWMLSFKSAFSLSSFTFIKRLFSSSLLSAIRLVVVQLLSCVWLFVTPWPAAGQPSLSFTISWSLLKLMFIELVMLSNHLILCRPFSSCLQYFLALGSFPMSWLFTSGGQSIWASASALVLPMNIQACFPLGLTGLISLQPKRLSRVFSNITVESINSSGLSLLYGPILASIHDYWKNHCFDYMDICQQINVSAF